MKIENGSIFDQTVQKEKPFEKTSAGVSFAKTAKAKLDAYPADISLRLWTMRSVLLPVHKLSIRPTNFLP